MKRGKTLPISELVRAVCREEGLETPLNEYRLINSWSKVLSPAVCRYPKDLKIYNQVLFVTVTSSVLRQELLMNRKSLVARLNAEVNAQVITDIVFK